MVAGNTGKYYPKTHVRCTRTDAGGKKNGKNRRDGALIHPAVVLGIAKFPCKTKTGRAIILSKLSDEKKGIYLDLQWNSIKYPPRYISTNLSTYLFIFAKISVL